jgi:hypothetical protein
MINKPPELLVYDRPMRSDFSRRESGVPYALRRAITVGLFMLLFGFGGYKAYHYISTPGAIPTIKAESAYKERPTQPGGIDIPHQDVQVYHEIDGHAPAADSSVEHMLPPPEEPMASATTPMKTDVAMPAPPAVENMAPQAAADDDPIGQQLSPPVATTVAPATRAAIAPVPAIQAFTPPQQVAPQPAQSAPPSAVTSQPKVEALASAPAVPSSVPSIAHAATPSSSKDHMIIQVASVPDATVAQSMAKKLQNRYASVLGTTTLHTVRADLGAKGVYYRIQSAPLAAADAQHICAALKNMNAGCFLVHP